MNLPPNRKTWPAIVALLLLVPVPSLGTAAGMVWMAGTPLGQALFLGAKIWLLLLPAAWYVVVERGKVGISKPISIHVGVGVASGLVLAGAMLGWYSLLGRHWIDAEHMHEVAQENGLGRPGVYVAMAVYWVTLNSLLEEYVWRWFVVRQCQKLMPTGLAVVASAAFFTLHHIVAMAVQVDWRVTTLASAGVFVGGIVWSGLYAKYRSIWPGYISHALADVPIFIVGWWLIVA